MKTNLLQPAAMHVLFAAFGVAIILCIRRGESIHIAFEKLAVGFFAITFSEQLFTGLKALGLELEGIVTDPKAQEDLMAFVGQSLFTAASKFDASHPAGMAGNLVSYLAQAFRTGVWGILASFTEFVFVLATFILTATRDALWQIALILFPMAAAFFPVSPKILLSAVAFTVELALWLPILALINVATSEVARRYSTVSHDFGFYVLAVEIVSITLTTAVPLIAHKLVSGALSGNIVDSWKSVFQTGTSVISGIPYMKSISGVASVIKFSSGMKGVLVLILGGALLASSIQAAEALILKRGFLKKISCQGRLYATGIGDESIVELEALPQNLGCGVILKPIRAGQTNMILETSTGTIERMISVQGGVQKPKSKEQEVKR